MVFNSLEYLIFLVLIFILYWRSDTLRLRWQNLIVLGGSYLFYAWWDWRFLSLIILSTLVDYTVALRLVKTSHLRWRRVLMWSSVGFNLGVLGFFKYYNFFVDNWVRLFESLGYVYADTWLLEIILPVGISFYTFQTMSYTIDVYRQKVQPTSDLISFATYVAFFPQLVAGPIERASHLLPQMLHRRVFSYEHAVQGVHLIIWGLFKKVFIADSLAPMVNDIFENYSAFDGGTLFLGAIYFAIQIYCDFSGYSDIAIGTSHLFGFDLRSNFKFPYFSRNIAEFWRRWHISLSTWFRDYLYIPLGGSRTSNVKALRNVFIVFIVSGFWHGANWTFVVWGFIHALLYIPLFIKGNHRKFVSHGVAERKWFPNVTELTQMVTTFSTVTIAWIFFRSENLTHAFGYLTHLIQNFHIPSDYVKGLGYVGLIIILDWMIRSDERLSALKKPQLTIPISIILILCSFVKFNQGDSTFIYFQF